MKAKKLLTLFVFALGMVALHAQRAPISGKVTEEKSGAPVVGASVVLKGTQQGTLTDADGNFRINAQKGDVLVISFVGYETQEVTVGDASQINISMRESLTALEEIVVIGYGTVKKSDATGSVAVVTAKDFNRGAINTSELITGKSAGVVITPSSGQPGTSATIRIRGGSSLNASNDPLLVIDGVPVTSSNLNLINPNDIESFTVLKDASATAIYGARASNGVILITTKKGSKEFQVTYNGTVGINTLPKKIDVLSASEYRNLLNELVRRSATDSIKYSKARALMGTANTDWQDEITRNAITHDHNVSLSGSIVNVPVRASLGYTDQQGTIINSDMQRSSLSLGISPTLFDDHLKVNANAKGIYFNNNWGNAGSLGAAVAFDPTHPVRDTSARYIPWGGYYTWLQPSGNPITIATANPVALAELADNKSNTMQMIGNIELDYKVHFLPDLHVNVNLGLDYQKKDGHDNLPKTASWTFQSNLGRKAEYKDNFKNKLLDIYLNYNKEIPAISSQISAMGGYSWQNFYEDHYYYSTNFDRTVKNDSTSTATELQLISFFGRLQYILLERYMVTVTVRQDGTSRFSPDTRWGLFPSVALAWSLNKEPFLRDIKALSELKLRLSYGVTGQQNIASGNLRDYIYLSTYKRSYDDAMYQFGNQFYYTLRPNAYDANIKWEETSTYNAGLDFGFLNNRITGTFDIYKRNSKDLLNYTTVPAGTNFANYIYTNVGTLEIKGFEASINARVISTKDFVWEVGANFAYNTNKITQLRSRMDSTYAGDEFGFISGGVGNRILINSLGKPRGSFYMFEQQYDSLGRPIEGAYRKDTTGKDIKVHYHTPDPKYTIGFTTRVQYKNFDFSLSARANIGNYVYNNIASNQGTYQNIYNPTGYINNVHASVLKTNFEVPQYWSNYYVENASFFRIDNISFGYTFPNIIGKGSLKISAIIQNALVISDYSGIDPEVDGGIDNNIYPRPRIYQLGINLTF
ncbi:MAG TPA: TonB-dependent receptor [Bacteroidales bacterium]|nr:TonB-dependent receptor [Bacteroidales bacterium]